MNIQETIQNWNKKPRELVRFLTKSILHNKNLFPQLIEILKTGSDVDKGTCADIMKHLSAEKPEIFVPYINNLIGYINYKAPRVKWGVPESIGNLAKNYSGKVEKAVPYLLKNTIENKENTIVVRWCAAYALSEIAKASRKKELIEKLRDILEKEKNNGVKNVYLKTLKYIEKDSSS